MNGVLFGYHLSHGEGNHHEPSANGATDKLDQNTLGLTEGDWELAGPEVPSSPKQNHRLQCQNGVRQPLNLRLWPLIMDAGTDVLDDVRESTYPRNACGDHRGQNVGLQRAFVLIRSEIGGAIKRVIAGGRYRHTEQCSRHVANTATRATPRIHLSWSNRRTHIAMSTAECTRAQMLPRKVRSTFRTLKIRLQPQILRTTVGYKCDHLLSVRDCAHFDPLRAQTGSQNLALASIAFVALRDWPSTRKNQTHLLPRNPILLLGCCILSARCTSQR